MYFIIAYEYTRWNMTALVAWVRVCACVYVCRGMWRFILLIQGQFLIMQSEYMETLLEYMH